MTNKLKMYWDDIEPKLDNKLWKEVTVKLITEGKIYMASTPSGVSNFMEEYVGEWVNDKPIRIVTEDDLHSAIYKHNMTLEEVLELCPIGILPEKIKILYIKINSEAWGLLYA